MKFIGKLLLYILIALLVVIAGLYFLLQTRWGAEHISAWVSENSDYHLAFGAMDHRFSAPSHIVLKNVTFGRDGQPATLVAKSVDIALSSRQLTEPRHVDTILLENGTLNLTDQTAPLPFKADRLQLRDMAFNSPNSEWKPSAQRVMAAWFRGHQKPVKCWVRRHRFSLVPDRFRSMMFLPPMY